MRQYTDTTYKIKCPNCEAVYTKCEANHLWMNRVLNIKQECIKCNADFLIYDNVIRPQE